MTGDVALWPTPYARAVLGEPVNEAPNRFGPPVVVPCLGCLTRDQVRRSVADCTCWDDWTPPGSTW